MSELAIRILNPAEGQFLRRIEWNKEEFQGWMQELSARYADTAIITPDDLKASKADRSELNKVKKAIDARRIEVKKAVMEPYEAFEKELTEATADVDKVSSAIDKSIKDYEAAEKASKKKRLQKAFENEKAHPFYEDVPAEELAFLTFDRIFDPKWLNATCKIAKAEKEMNERLSKIENDLRSILTMDTEPALRAGALQEYRRTLDLGSALRLHGDLTAKAQREKEEQRRREEEAAERKRREDIEALRSRLSAEDTRRQSTRVANPPEPPVPAEPREAPVSGFASQGQGNPQAAPQNVTQRQAGGNFGHSDMMGNGTRYNNPQYGQNMAAPQTGPAPMAPPPVQEKTYFVEFRVEGTKDQLMSLKAYMDSNGLRYGKVQK